jgi:uncharacterized protein (DUF362 family)
MTSVTAPVVSVVAVRDDVRAAVREALELADWRAAVPAGCHVAVKVNLGWDRFVPGSITSPAVVEALIGVLSERARAVTLIEADQVLEDIEKAFRTSGMAEVCARTGAGWVNLSRTPLDARVECADNVVVRAVSLPRWLREAVLVSVPVMKTHGKTVISGALKNQWGCLDKSRHEYHLVLAQAIADVNVLVRPALALMDGTIGLEGDGPKSGRPRIADRVLCSRDLVALDTVQAAVMGFEPRVVAHLAEAERRGLGTASLEQIELRGLSLDEARVPFRPARENAVGRVETLLRRSLVRRLVFGTPLFSACLWMARRYYDAWTLRHARRCWQIARAHPVYGPQWRRVGPAPSPAAAAARSGARHAT